MLWKQNNRELLAMKVSISGYDSTPIQQAFIEKSTDAVMKLEAGGDVARLSHLSTPFMIGRSVRL